MVFSGRPRFMMQAQQNLLPQGEGGVLGAVTPEGITVWLDSLPPSQPLVSAEAITLQIPLICRHSPNLRARFKHLELLLLRTDPIICELERILDHCSLPLAPVQRLNASGADKLLKTFADAYFTLAELLNKRWFRLAFAKIHALVTLRAAQLAHRRALLDHRVYSSGSPRRWEQFTRLLAMAQENGFAEKPVDPDSADTVERVIVHTSLIALADPATLGGEDLSRLRYYIERYGHLARLSPTAPPPSERETGVFLVSASTRGPRHLKAEHRLKVGESVLDARPFLAKLRRQVEGLRRGASPMRVGLPAEAQQPSYLHLLVTSLERWALPRSRRHSRAKFQPHADLVAGFDAIRQFMTSSAFRRRRSDRLQGLGNDQTPISEWTITNQSPTGFGIRLLHGESGAVNVGELVALRPKETAVVHVCIARRARSIAATDFEIGLELLAELGVPATISKPVGTAMKTVPILLLPKVPQLGGKPALIAPPGEVPAGLEFVVPHKGRKVRLVTVETLQRLASCDFISLRSAGPD